MKITSRCGDAAIAGLNEALLAKAAASKLLRTDKVRADTTVVEADAGYPTDSGPFHHPPETDGGLGFQGSSKVSAATLT